MAVAVVALNRAVPLSMVSGPQAALAEVERLERDGRLAGYHYLPAIKADLLAGSAGPARRPPPTGRRSPWPPTTPSAPSSTSRSPGRLTTPERPGARLAGPVRARGPLVGGPYARHERDGGGPVEVTGTQPEDVAPALRGGNVRAARGDQGVEVPVVLAEVQQVGGGRAGGLGHGGDQVPGPVAQGGQFGVIQAGQQLGVAAHPEEEPSGHLVAGRDLRGPQLVAEDDRAGGRLFHLAQQAAAGRARRGNSH